MILKYYYIINIKKSPILWHRIYVTLLTRSQIHGRCFYHSTINDNTEMDNNALFSTLVNNNNNNKYSAINDN